MTDAQTPRRPRWARLGTELRRLRIEAGFSQQQLHEVLGISKSQVERWEKSDRGGTPPSVPEAMAWARACAGANQDLVLLEALAKAALSEHTPFRDWGSQREIQEDIRRDEAQAAVIRNFNNWGIPGLLQTMEYARRVLALGDVRGFGEADDALEVRMGRQVILLEEGRQFEFLLTEAALRWRPAPLPVSALQIQLAYLAQAVSRPSVQFGVIPARTATYAVPNCPFVLYELREEGKVLATVELPHERAEARAPVHYADYLEIYQRLWGSALTGGEAVEFVRDVAASLGAP